MLATTPPSPPSLLPTIRFLSPSLRIPLLPPLLARSWLCSIGHAPGRARSGSRASAGSRGYERIPMDTAGAYRLVDRETGEKFIVWGGSDDNDDSDSTIPSEEVLSWSPTTTGTQKKSDQVSTAGNIHFSNCISKAETVTQDLSSTIPKVVDIFFDTTGVDAYPTITQIGAKTVTPAVGSFRRLKVQKVKALIKNSTRNCMEDAQVGAARNIMVANTIDANFRQEQHYKEKLGYSALHKEVETTDSLDVYSGQEDGAPYPQRSVRTVTSFKGWGGAAPNQNATASQLKNYRKKATDSGFFSRKSFKDIGCTDYMVEALRGLMFLRPSHIQAMAYRSILEGKSCIIADQSGSGKTIAYLAPTIQCLRQEELQGLSKSASRSPRVIILVPTAELASQVLSNCRSMAKHGVPFRSIIATGGFKQKTQLDNLNEESDVLIVTPGRLIYLLQKSFLQLASLRCIVLDEVDILFKDEAFEQVLESLISSAPVSMQYLFVTATLPIDIYNKVVEIFPDCEVIMGPGMHRTSSGLEEVLVDCSGADEEEKNPDTAFLNKKSALLQILEESLVPKTIIFCNKIETCRKVENVLRRFDRKGSQINVLPFHAAIAQEIRLSNMREFLSSHSKDSMFLICTDRASRGIDFAGVDHVVLFDFPRDPSEYVRRVGRTARGAGGKGKAYVFVVGKQVSFARRIMERNKKGHPLHDLPCTNSAF